MRDKIETDVVVLGGGPGGYTAAFRAADLGKQVVLIEKYDVLGGVCLNVGCIPSKALLHAAKVIDEAKYFNHHGINFGEPDLDFSKIVSWKQSIVKQLTDGLAALAKMRKVTVVHGTGNFASDREIIVNTVDGENIDISFNKAIIAVGSRSINLPFIPSDPRIFTSTDALECKYTKGKMLIIGGGIIGLEMATVYASFGCDITIVDIEQQIMTEADIDLIKPYTALLKKRYQNIYLETKVTAVTTAPECIKVAFENKEGKKFTEEFASVLVAVGRKPNGKQISAEKAGIYVDKQGFIPVNTMQQTNVKHIYAVGDVVGQPMLAHKSIPEGKIAAENIAGKQHHFEPKSIPSVAYTNPEIAWTGVSETVAKAQGINYKTGIFPWSANGRTLANGDNVGLTKLIFNTDNNTIIGAAILGANAGDLISEAALAIEMACDAEDISLTIHPHPTLSETIVGASEMFEGTITDLMPSRHK